MAPDTYTPTYVHPPVYSNCTSTNCVPERKAPLVPYDRNGKTDNRAPFKKFLTPKRPS